MVQNTNEIKESVNLILNQLECIEFKPEEQNKDIKTYIERSSTNLNLNELLIAGLKSTRTSFELLRDEIDELHN